MSAESESEVDVRVMEWMGPETMEQYTKLLENIERAQKEHDAALEAWRAHDEKVGYATTDMHEHKLRAIAAHDVWSYLLDQRIKELKRITKLMDCSIEAWDKAAAMALNAIEAVVSEGKLPSNSGSKEAYWKLVYARIASKHGTELAADKCFRALRLMEFLTTIFPNRIPEFAEMARDGGKPMLAQALEELAI